MSDDRGYSRLPTAPTPVTVETGPDADHIGWQPDAIAAGAATGSGATPAVASTPRIGPWALLAAIVALVASFFVGWGIPLAIIAVVASIIALRRPVENRALAIWSLVLAVLATLYSAGWLVWYAYEFNILG